MNAQKHKTKNLTQSRKGKTNWELAAKERKKEN